MDTLTKSELILLQLICSNEAILGSTGWSTDCDSTTLEQSILKSINLDWRIYKLMESLTELYVDIDNLDYDLIELTDGTYIELHSINMHNVRFTQYDSNFSVIYEIVHISIKNMTPFTKCQLLALYYTQ